MRETKREMMRDVQGAIKPHLIASNTVEYHRPDGARVIRLHQTDILAFRPDGKIVVDTSGWQTVTTKDRLNRYLRPLGFTIAQERGKWSVARAPDYWRGPVVPFYDGMVLPDAFDNPAKGAKAEAKADKLLTQITKFVNRLDKLATLPQPDTGDCWGCAMAAKDGSRPMGKDCVAGHLKEGYLHGSLILRAMEARNYGNIQVVWSLATHDWPGWRSRVKSDLRRFLKSELGLVR